MIKQLIDVFIKKINRKIYKEEKRNKVNIFPSISKGLFTCILQYLALWRDSVGNKIICYYLEMYTLVEVIHIV
jgi:hypothetical protein